LNQRTRVGFLPQVTGELLIRRWCHGKPSSSPIYWTHNICMLCKCWDSVGTLGDYYSHFCPELPPPPTCTPRYTITNSTVDTNCMIITDVCECQTDENSDIGLTCDFWGWKWCFHRYHLPSTSIRRISICPILTEVSHPILYLVHQPYL
jgi:hypothetical protein